MTESKVLADALVEVGILTDHGVPDIQKSVSTRKVYSFDNRLHHKSAELWITDWRVAGKVLESMDGPTLNEFAKEVIVTTRQYSPYPTQWTLHRRICDPRAIIEAWYQAKEQSDD